MSHRFSLSKTHDAEEPEEEALAPSEEDERLEEFVGTALTDTH
jgi:hypothetical protein